MFKAKYKIYHKCCWATELSEKFPDLDIRLFDCLYFKDHTIGIFTVRGESKYFKDIIKVLKQYKIAKKYEILDKGKDYMYLRVHTYKEKEYETITYYVVKNNCFLAEPARLLGGNEIWPVGAEKRDNLSKLYKDLQKIGKVELIFIKKAAFDPELTDQQRKIINLAKDLGYYDWPRKISVTKLAEYFGLGKSTFIEHLRKAENKIIMNS